MPKDKDKKKVTNKELPPAMQTPSSPKTDEEIAKEVGKKAAKNDKNDKNDKNAKKSDKKKETTKKSTKTRTPRKEESKTEKPQKQEVPDISPELDREGRTQNFRGFEVTPEDYDILTSRKGGKLSERGQKIQEQVGFTVPQADEIAQGEFQKRPEEVFQGEQARNVAELMQQERQTQDVERFLEQVRQKQEELGKTPIQQEEAMREKSGLGMEREDEDTLKEAAIKGIRGKSEATIARTFGKLGIFDFSVNDLLDAARQPEFLSELESTTGQIGEEAQAIRGYAGAGAIPQSEAMAELNRRSRNIAILEERIHEAAALSKEVQTSGEYVSALQEIETAKTDLREARKDLLEEMREEKPEFDPEETRRILRRVENLDEKYRKRRERMKNERVKKREETDEDLPSSLRRIRELRKG